MDLENVTLIRNNHLASKVVFIDGLPGCGKTHFSTIISSLHKVEKITYSYDIEQLCAIAYLNRIEPDAVVAMIRMSSDLLIYDSMMSRNVNFRPSDLSSIFNHPDKLKYLKRLFSKGDLEVPKRIVQEKPILPITVHNLLMAAMTIFKALKERVVFIEIVRHPLYMIIQQALNNEKLIFNARDFSVYFEYNEKEMPWYTLGWEEQFINANPVEKAIYFIEKVGDKMGLSKKNLDVYFPCQILTIPFEDFVTKPDIYLNEIAKLIDSEITKSTLKTMIKQKVPRKKYSDGIPLDIYKRCGWVPPKGDLTEMGEFNVRRQFVLENASPEAIKILDKLCADYEAKYMGGKLIGENGYKS